MEMKIINFIVNNHHIDINKKIIWKVNFSLAIPSTSKFPNEAMSSFYKDLLGGHIENMGYNLF